MFTCFECDLSGPTAGPVSPEFMVGPDTEGHWLVVGTTGRAGGLFANQESAMRYAMLESNRRRGAVRVVNGPLVLKL